MARTHRERILDYLWSIAPETAGNAEIAAGTGISPLAQVFQFTRRLLHEGLIYGRQEGREWRFGALEDTESLLTSPGRASQVALREPSLSHQQFIALARSTMSEHYGAELETDIVPPLRKAFHLVSPDRSIVGAAQYFGLVAGSHPPPARFSVISEAVWLLEKTLAPTLFLVCGGDPDVPALWLRRHGRLAPAVMFFHLADDGTLSGLRQAREP